MRELLDWLDDHIEPYVSFRFLLGLVFAAIFVNWAIGAWLALRELNVAAPSVSPREQQLRRIMKLYAWVLLLRSASWRNLREHLGMMAQIAVLLLLAILMSTGVFASP